MDRVDASIVVATWNEAAHIEACVRSIFAAEPFADSFEVLIVDGGSEDGTPDIVRRLAAEFPQIRLLSNPARITPVGFNTGIKASRGDWILILGAHSEYDPSYFRLCLETARRTKAWNTGGRVVWHVKGEGFESLLARALGTSRFGMGFSPYRRDDVAEGPADAVVFGCFPREVFEKIGLHDERLVRNQDTELNKRIQRAGGVIWLNPDIKVHYSAFNTVRGVLSRAFAIGRWNPYMWWLAPDSVQPRHAVPGLFVVSLAVPGLNVLALAAHTAVGSAAAAAEAKRYHDARLAPLLPPLFLALHASYGLGILAGSWDLVRGRAPVQRPAQVERLEPRA